MKFLLPTLYFLLFCERILNYYHPILANPTLALLPRRVLFSDCPQGTIVRRCSLICWRNAWEYLIPHIIHSVLDLNLMYHSSHHTQYVPSLKKMFLNSLFKPCLQSSYRLIAPIRGLLSSKNSPHLIFLLFQLSSFHSTLYDLSAYVSQQIALYN